MRIIQINVNYGFGSTGTIVRDLHNLCLQNGIDSEVVCSSSVYNSKNIYKIGNTFTNKLHAILSRISGKQGYFSYFSTIKLLWHLKQQKIDAIHLHNLHSCYINLPMILKYAAKKNIPIIVTLHDCWFYTGGCCHYTSIECFKWKVECGSCPKRKQEVNALLLDRTSNTLKDRYYLFGLINNLYAVGVSQWIVNEAQQTVFKNAHCVAIHNGIDTDFFHPIDSNIRKKFGLDNKFVILAPSNKWFLDINNETFEYFASHLTDDMIMLFIGNNCDKRRLTDKMINYGFISSKEELRNVYSAADVMINCTREESLSLLNLEVQACGTPVITYSNTGVKETVDGYCSYAVENGNHKAMWDTMQIIKNKGKDFYSKNCIEWINREYNKKDNYIKYLKLYKSILRK